MTRMTNQEAKRILVEKFGEGCFKETYGVYVLEPLNGETFVLVPKDKEMRKIIELDNIDSPEQLEAIAQWMRDPESVMNAEDKTP